MFWDLLDVVIYNSSSPVKSGLRQRLENDQNLRHCQWRMNRIVQVFRGTDGIVRAVDVEFDEDVYRRRIKRLCLLEPDLPVSKGPDLGENGPLADE